MDETTLLALIAENESDRLELTTSINDTDKFSEAICAFANDLPNHRRPGYLMIGVRDDGEILGARVTDDLLKNLGALRDNGNIQPLPTIFVEKVPTSKAILLSLLPSPRPCHRCDTEDVLASATAHDEATQRTRKRSYSTKSESRTR